MGPNGRLTIEERAKQICREQSDQLNKKELMIKFKCSPETANEVYRLKGWKTLSKSDAAKIGVSKKRANIKTISGFDLLRRAW